MVWVSLHTIISTTSCQPHHQGVGRWSSKDHTPRACEFAGETMEVAARRGIARSSVKSRETWLREWVGQCRGSSYSPSFINVFIQSLGHTPSDSLTHWFKNSLLHWVYASIHWLLIRSFVRSFIHSFVRLLVRSCIHSFLQPFVHWFTQTCSFFMSLVACHLIGISKTISSFAHAPRNLNFSLLLNLTNIPTGHFRPRPGTIWHQSYQHFMGYEHPLPGSTFIGRQHASTYICWTFI